MFGLTGHCENVTLINPFFTIEKQCLKLMHVQKPETIILYQ